MLQCFEFFKRRGADVQFGMDKTAAPDLIIRLTSNACLTFYAECYVYTKWWFVESFLNDVCMCLGDDIALQRIYNVPGPSLGSVNKKTQFLDKMCEPLVDERLMKARNEAKRRYPVELVSEGDLRLVVNGNNEDHYEPQTNAHGDPAGSRDVFLREIIQAKKCSNGLATHRPNLVMVNGLGPDFQLIFTHPGSASSAPPDLHGLDALLIAGCGIDAELTRSRCQLMLFAEQEHPIRELLDS
jgi:hypothetical protein